MNLAPTKAAATPETTASGGRYGLADLMRSEWTKLRTVRSTNWTLGVTVLGGLVASATATWETRAHWATTTAANRAAFDPVTTSLMGAYLTGMFLLGVLGILVVSSEYGTGTVRATFAAAPRRPMVVAAKALVFGAVALVVSEVVTFASFFLGQAFLTSPTPHDTLSSPGALRAVAGMGIFLCVVGVFALGTALLARHTAGAISVYVGVILVLPIIVGAFPAPLHAQIERLLPVEIGSVMINNGHPGDLGPWTGLLLLCGYTVMVLAVGTVLLVRRDA
jgi:ABC-2 type transport system permease protein